MTADQTQRWHTVRAVFEAVVDLAPRERAAALAQRCAHDASLRHDVERLLHADADAAIVVTPHRLAAGFTANDDPLGVGSGNAVVGGFVVRRLLGTGGMGAVYEAEQQQPRRAVALKVLRPELCTGKTLRRFQVEAEILGRLQHPGIAEVYAAGVHRSESGPFRWEMPWYAMELLASAQPITHFARAHGLPLAQRLHLFERACSAVQHAHQRGVIHRDLKPGNVLVDADGRVKVIDFGVARATDREDAQLTATGVQVGTPNYMAPEQIEAADDVDVRCDVWALGVLLYELLTDRLPFRADTRTPNLAHYAAPPPSLRLQRAEIPLELEWIVLKALAVERERRYDAAGELAADLARLRRNEPVLAAPPSTLYRLHKAVRRHRGLALGSALGLLCLLTGLVAATVAWRRAYHAEQGAQRAAKQAQVAEATARTSEAEARESAREALAEKARADAARAEAERNLETAHAVSHQNATILDLLQGATVTASRRNGGRDVSVAELFEQIAERADADPALSPMARAISFNYLGALRFFSGDYLAAESHLRRSLEELQLAGQLGSMEELRSHSSLSEALRLQGEYEESHAELRRAIAIAEATLAPSHPQHLSLRRREVFALLQHGATAEAVRISRELLAAHEQSDAAGKGAAEALGDLGVALYANGDNTEAAAVAQRAQLASRAAFGVGSERAVHAALTLANSWLRTGRAADALTLLDETLAEAERVLPDEHPRLRSARQARGNALHVIGDHAGAVAVLQGCWHACQNATNVEPREVLGLAANLATAMLATGDANAAVELTAPWADDQPDAPPAVRRELLDLHLARARALLRQGDKPAARALLDAALARSSELRPPEHATVRELRAERARAQ